MSIAEIDRVAEHLEVCAPCLFRLESLQPGLLEQGMKNAAAAPLSEWEDDDDSEIDSKAKRVLDTVFPDVNQAVVNHHGSEMFKIVKQVGVVAIGGLYLAQDLVMEKHVMLIIPSPGKVASLEQRNQLVIDGNNACWLKHENILRVIQFGPWDEHSNYLALPLITRYSLGVLLEKKVKIDVVGVLKVLGQICQAIRFAHEHNIVHRHLNPYNVFVDEQLHVFVSEFGLVADGRYHFGLTEPIHAPTPFNSPESIRNEPKRIDVRTDIYSIGAILDAMLNLSKMTSEQMTILRAIARRCQRTSRQRRFQTVNELMKQVRDDLAGLFKR